MTARTYWLCIRDRKPIVGVCFGKDRPRLFIERNQGTMGIPVNFYYLLGGRATIILGQVIRERRASHGDG